MTGGNAFPRPFMVTAEDAARRIMRGLPKGRFEIAWLWQPVALMMLGDVLLRGAGARQAAVRLFAIALSLEESDPCLPLPAAKLHQPIS